jgi:hypothetical protein
VPSVVLYRYRDVPTQSKFAVAHGAFTGRRMELYIFNQDYAKSARATAQQSLSLRFARTVRLMSSEVANTPN